uniref:Uncharacterized protein n=1 Tax=Ciona intestinalis TaxID=7719 RepID=H2XS05_CIOIN
MHHHTLFSHFSETISQSFVHCSLSSLLRGSMIMMRDGYRITRSLRRSINSSAVFNVPVEISYFPLSWDKKQK